MHNLFAPLLAGDEIAAASANSGLNENLFSVLHGLHSPASRRLCHERESQR
jgi:hypothetical protein